jgi:hypothetical protein
VSLLLQFWLSEPVLLALQPILRSWETFLDHLAGIEKSVAALAKPFHALEEENSRLKAERASAWDSARTDDKSYWLQCHRILDEMGVSAVDDPVNADYDGMPGYYLRQRLGILQRLLKYKPLLLVQLRSREEERERIARTEDT